MKGTPSLCSSPCPSHGLWPALLADCTVVCLSSPICLLGLPSSAASRLRSGNPQSTAPHSLLFLSSPKDVSGGDSCTSEEEPTFDPGYEPDWAVISTVRPQSRHLEPTRGRLSLGP